MAITFDTFTVHNRGTPQTVEESFRVYGAWAGIHEYEFDSRLQDAALAVLSSAATWTPHIYDEDLPVDCLLEFDVDRLDFGVIFKCTDSDDYVRLGIMSNGNALLHTVVAGNQTLKTQRKVYGPTKGRVKFAYRQQRFSDDPLDVWDCISLWINDTLVFTHLMETVAVNTTLQMGLAAYGAVTVNFSNVRVPQMTEFAEWSSLDPGEVPMGGLQRSIEGRYTKFHIRFNGALRAWQPAVRPVSATFTNTEADEQTRDVDKRQIYTHVRMLGAYEQAEYHRMDLTVKHGYRFMETSNPYLMSERECYIQAQREIQRMEEQLDLENVASPFTPLLEPEDHIVLPEGDRIISGRSWSMSPGKVDQSLSCRKYIYGS